MPGKPMSPLPLDGAARLFRILGDETRLRILKLLEQNTNLCVSDLCEILGESQPAVSHHLSMLSKAGLVSFRRDGKHNFYYLAMEQVRPLIKPIKI